MLHLKHFNKNLQVCPSKDTASKTNIQAYYTNNRTKNLLDTNSQA